MQLVFDRFPDYVAFDEESQMRIPVTKSAEFLLWISDEVVAGLQAFEAQMRGPMGKDGQKRRAGKKPRAKGKGMVAARKRSGKRIDYSERTRKRLATLAAKKAARMAGATPDAATWPGAQAAAQ